MQYKVKKWNAGICFAYNHINIDYLYASFYKYKKMTEQEVK